MERAADTTRVVDQDNPDVASAVYKGLAISTLTAARCTRRISAPERVEAYDSELQPDLDLRRDFSIPACRRATRRSTTRSSPSTANELYVTYAKQDADKHDDVAGLGNGFVDVFNLDGTDKRRLISERRAELAVGPAARRRGFGSFGGDLLVGNFGNGWINAYDPMTGAFEGTLDGTDGNPLVIDGLWGLTFGNGGGGRKP